MAPAPPARALPRPPRGHVHDVCRHGRALEPERTLEHVTCDPQIRWSEVTCSAVGASGVGVLMERVEDAVRLRELDLRFARQPHVALDDWHETVLDELVPGVFRFPDVDGVEAF